MFEKTLSTKEIFNGKVFQVEHLEVELENGMLAHREVVRHRGGVACLALTKNQEVYLVKQYRKAIEQEFVELPAGKLEKDEDPFLAIQRELKEETGLTAKTWTFLGAFYATPGYCTEKIYLYLAEDLEEGQANLDEGEFVEILKMPLSTLEENLEIQDMKTALALAMYKNRK